MNRRAPKDPDRVVVETFGFPSYLLSHYKRGNPAPSCFNGEVRVERYRITVERIEEDADVIFSRLVEMWETCDNHHHWQPLRQAAAALGREFTTRQGCRRTKP